MMRVLGWILAGLLLSYPCLASAAEAVPNAAPRFEITGYRVEGSRVLPQGEIEKILAPFTGGNKDFATVEEAREALETAYRRRGYTTVQVTLPEQELEHGTVFFNVIEYRIGEIAVTGNRHFSRENILRSLPGLRKGESPDIRSVSTSLREANENPAKKINLQMKAGAKDDEVDAIIEVKDERPWKVGITADTTGDGQTGYFRTGIFLQHANLFDLDHLLTLQYITSPEKPKDVNIFGMGYRVPFYSLGSALDFIAAYSDVNSGSISAASYNLLVSGKGTMLGTHYSQNLPRIGDYVHKAIVGLDYRTYENHVQLEGIEVGNDVTVHPISLTYTGVYAVSRINTGFYLTVSRNLPGSWDGDGSQSAFDTARAGAPHDYTILRYGLNVACEIGRDWQAQVRFNAQYTGDPLVPGEQFGLGGASSVRGFHEREIANDKGYFVNAEIYTPDLCRVFRLPYAQCRLVAFYDHGHVSRNESQPGDIENTTVSSTGVGVRIVGNRYFTLSANYGIVIDTGGVRSRWSGLADLSVTVMF